MSDSEGAVIASDEVAPPPGPVPLPGEVSADMWLRYIEERGWEWMVVGTKEHYDSFCSCFLKAGASPSYYSPLVIFLLGKLLSRSKDSSAPDPPADVEAAFVALETSIVFFLRCRPEKKARIGQGLRELLKEDR